MQSNLWLDLGSLLNCLACLGLIVAIVHRRLVRSWPSLVSYAAFTVLTQTVLSLIRAHYEPFFWIYWCTSGILIFIRAWIVFDVLRAVPGIQLFPRAVAQIFGVAVTAVAIGSTVLAVQSGTPFANEIVRCVLLSSKAVNLATVGILITLHIGFLLSRFGWSERSFDVSTAMCFRAILGSIATAMLGSSLLMSNVANILNTLSELTFMIVCSWVMHSSSELQAAPPQIVRVIAALRRTTTAPRDFRP